MKASCGCTPERHCLEAAMLFNERKAAYRAAVLTDELDDWAYYHGVADEYRDHMARALAEWHGEQEPPIEKEKPYLGVGVQ